MKSKVIAISAISSGLCALVLTVGAYIEFADLFALAISSIFVIMPLYYGSYKGCFMSFLVAGVIAFMFSGFNIISLVFPSYLAFFGIFPIVKCIMQDKNVNKIVSFIVGLIWFIATAYGMYFYYTLVMSGVFKGLPSWIADNILIFIAPLAAVVYIIFNRYISVMRIVIDKYLRRVIK